jgi:L-alanine-DL-glutamate epimerase-like enolase superfamily enzyme
MGVIESIRFRKVARPLRNTFSTSLAKKMSWKASREGLSQRGSTGFGECPTSFVLRNETVGATENIIREAALQLKNLHIETYNRAIEKFRKRYPRNPMAISGLEVALFRAYLAHQGREEREYFGGKLDSLETDITIPFIRDSAALERWMRYAFRKGFVIYKIKVSGNVADDKRLVTEVYRLLRDCVDGFVVCLDGNQGFTEKRCLIFLDFLASNDFPIELFEQPLKKEDYKGLREVGKRSPVPIILDESVFAESDLKYAVEEGLCRGINIKIAKSGISESLKLYNLAKKHGLSLMMGCMTETMVGLSAGIHFAAGTGGFDYIDLDAVHFLSHPGTWGSIRIDGSKYHLLTQ